MPGAGGRVSLAEQLVQTARCVQAVQAGRSLADALPGVPGELRPGVQALTFHALRHLGTTMALVSVLAERAPPPPVRALLGSALALLLPGVVLAEAGKPMPPLPEEAGEAEQEVAASADMADQSLEAGSSTVPRYTAFTVVNQAVAAARSVRSLASQAGLVNACLRRFLRESVALLAQVQTDWEAQWNHPAWWVKRVRRDHPQHWQTVLRASNHPAPLTLRVNETRLDRAAYLEHLKPLGWADFADEALVGTAGVTLARTGAARSGAVETLPGYADGWFSVQDAAAQLAAPLLLGAASLGQVGAGAQAARPLRVLDACAAPGGKTAHLLEEAHRLGLSLSLLALEVDAARSERIVENLQRLQLPAPAHGAGMVSDVHVKVADAAAVPTWWDGRLFDAILLDAPCTASGIGRRHPDVRWLRRETDVTALVATQRQLLDALWPLLAPGGRMVYCTCSVFKAEGQSQIEAFLSRHTDVRHSPAPGHLLPGVALGGGDMADNPAGGHDGFFYATLDKAPA